MPKQIGTQANGVSCSSIEHKMGIHGSPTCVLNFENAVGWLVGAPGGGLACMFTMMNHARLGVGLQGLGLSERALQAGVSYAFERRQGRTARAPLARGESADPIIVHPDVRRMVLTQKALTEGQRLLAYYTYMLEDVERLSPDAGERERAAHLVAVLVPIVKSLLTDSAMETTSLAVHIHGGSGFIRETGAEQYMRDAKIACIYEGTNGIQALDLLGRKVLANGGASVKQLVAEIGTTLAGPIPEPFRPWAAALTAGVEEWAALTRLVGERVAKDPDELRRRRGRLPRTSPAGCWSAGAGSGWRWSRTRRWPGRRPSASSTRASSPRRASTLSGCCRARTRTPPRSAPVRAVCRR